MPNLSTIDSWQQVPILHNHDAEAQYWAQHQISTELMQRCLFEADRSAVSISMRLDPKMLARIKRVASKRFLNYQSMIKQWIAERLERELADASRRKQT